MNPITIYHNPACGTSRNVLAMIRNSGEEPVVIEYLKTPPDRATLTALIAAMGVPVRAVLREKGTPYAELGLDDPKWSDEQLIGFMLQHPILINRPIVVTPLGTMLCRPSETVLDILPQPQRGAFSKEDGEAVVNAEGHPPTAHSRLSGQAERAGPRGPEASGVKAEWPRFGTKRGAQFANPTAYRAGTHGLGFHRYWGAGWPECAKRFVTIPKASPGRLGIRKYPNTFVGTT